MESLSSVPPPHERVTPFLAREGEEGRCYICNQPIAPTDRVIMIPVDSGKKRCPAKLTALFDALEISSEDEKRLFYQSFVAMNFDREPELLWFKLSRHNTPLFYLLLTKFNSR